MNLPTIAYLSNQFHSPVEPYVVDEVRELQRRGARVIPSSARRLDNPELCSPEIVAQTLYLQPLRAKLALRALYLCLAKFPLLTPFYRRVLLRGRESPLRRAKALIHTWLGFTTPCC